MIQWEYAELYNSNEEKYYYINGIQLFEDERYPVIRLHDALEHVGLDGWELIMKDKDEYGNKVYRLKRVKHWEE